MILKLKRTPGIYLVGFMGSGKTTVGRMLARELGWLFVDLDHDIEAAAQKSVSEIFDQDGEPRFRELESEALQRRIQKIRAGRPMVLALGGGTFTQQGNVELIGHNGVSIWLDSTLDVVRERISHSTHRPLARDPERLAQLYEERRTFYARADYRVPISVNDSQTALQQVLDLPLF